MTTKDGLDFDAIAIQIVNICGVPIGNDRNNLIYSIVQALKDAYNAGYTRSGIKDEQSAETIPDRDCLIILPEIHPANPKFYNESYRAGFADGQYYTFRETKRLNPHLFGEGK